MTRLKATALALGVSIIASPLAAHAAVSEDNFVAKTTGDIAQLCAAPSTDPLYTAAANFCTGFGVGIFSLLTEIQQADPTVRVVCAPESITRKDAIASFVAWAGKKAEVASTPAVDGVVQFLHETYPCPPLPETVSRGRKK